MRGIGSLAAVAVTLLCAAPVAAAQAPDVGGFHSVLGVGQGQTVNATDLAANQASGQPPDSFVNQLQMYSGVSRVASTLTASTLDKGWKDSGFRPQSAPGAVESPRAGVTIVRDPVYRVPRIYGVTRADTMFGAGYATAEDRLFLMEALRHTAEASTVELLGPGAAKDDAAAITHQDFSPEELQRQFDELPALGPEAAQGHQDVLDYIAGINAYIDQTRSDPSKLPAEYPALGVTPKPWTVPDTAAVAIYLVAQFTSNGGDERKTAALLSDFQQRFGPVRGRLAYEDFRRADDPEAPTVSHTAFPSDRPGKVNPAAVALPDAGSIKARDAIVSAPQASASALPAWAQTLARRGLDLPHHASNALLLDAKHSADGKPLAAMGPQVGYYSPEIFTEYELHGPGIDVSGVSFPGASPYPLIGHGIDFAWTGTTPNGDTVDTFAEKLCEPDGSPPTVKSTHYLYKGSCVAFTTRDQTMTTPVSPLDPTTPPQTVTLRAMRSVHGTITHFATVKGAPIALAESHATAFHELRSLLAFKALAENKPTDGASFQDVMRQYIGMENWFYVGTKDIAWLQSGWFPRHAKGVDLDLPIWGTGQYDWRAFKPDSFGYTRLPDSANPRAVNPPWGYLASWNNKEAPGWRAPPATWSFGPIQRVLLLERPLKLAMKRGKVDLATMGRISVRAATADLRATEVWSWMRRVIGRPPAGLIQPVNTLDAWAKTGGQRRDLDGDGLTENGPAIVLMDTFWPIAMQRMFQPVLGSKIVGDLTSQITPFRETFFFDGWWSWAQKDLRRVLRRPERQAFSRRYCGTGSLKRCRAVLVGALRDAVAEATKAQGGPLPTWKHAATCPKTDPPSCDQIVPITAGAIDTPPFPFHNRGTFHQLVEVDHAR